MPLSFAIWRTSAKPFRLRSHSHWSPELLGEAWPTLQALLLGSCLPCPRYLRGLRDLTTLTRLSRGLLQLSDGLLRCLVLKTGWGAWNSREPVSTFSRSGRHPGSGSRAGAAPGSQAATGRGRGNENSRLCSLCPDTSSTRSQQCVRGWPGTDPQGQDTECHTAPILRAGLPAVPVHTDAGQHGQLPQEGQGPQRGLTEDHSDEFSQSSCLGHLQAALAHSDGQLLQLTQPPGATVAGPGAAAGPHVQAHQAAGSRAPEAAGSIQPQPTQGLI